MARPRDAGALMESDAILTRLTGLHPRKIDLSLGRTLGLLEKLGNPQQRLPPVIHVAGTNGKGSTIAFMRAMLEAAGQRVHVYTSPHLVRFHERIRLAGELVDEGLLAATLAECERINDGAPITLFEITTAAAFKLFSEIPADILLLEVGLGGRFDSTNVVDAPLASVITPVSIDHVEFLGDTIAKIAFEKAGIIRRGAPVISAAQEAEGLEVIEREAQKKQAPLFVGGQDFGGREERGRFVFEDGDGLLDLPLPRLAGRHQLQNAATAIAALRRAAPHITQAHIEHGLLNAQWPARLQRLTHGALVEAMPAGAELWLDGGHNASGGRALAEAMAELEARSPRPLVMICASLTSKDTRGFLEPFSGLASEVFAAPIGGEHAGRAASEVAEAARAAGLKAQTCEGVADALAILASRAAPLAPRILIAGSLYLAGEVLRANGTPPR